LHTNDHNHTTESISNISDYLRLNADRFPDKPALLYPEKISYGELDNEVNRYSYSLEQAGIKTGYLTVLLVPAGTEFFILTFALLRIGAVPVMIDPGMGIGAMTKALTALIPDAFIGIPRAHLLRVFYPRIFRTVKTRITIGFQFFHGKDWLKNFQNNQIPKYPAYQVETNRISAVFFTSGSTGPAKGVIYTAGMLKSQIEVTKSHFKISPEEIDLCTFPLLGLFALCHGNSIVIADMNMIHPVTLNPAKIIQNIQDYGCTRMFGSPMVINKLAQYGQTGIKLLTLRKIISAGAPVHREILESFSKMLPDEAEIHTPYGATEALPVTDITASELLSGQQDEPEFESEICIGYVVEGLDVKIIEINDNPIPSWDQANQIAPGEIGEIVVKGPWVTTEYLNNPDANMYSRITDINTHEVWHRMGDLGRIDRLGRLWFYGRKSQRVITSDSTLFTIPCEAVYNHHPLVARSALVKIPDTGSGTKKPVICIQLKAGYSPTNNLKQEIYQLGKSNRLTTGIKDILFYKKFPVDSRHNAKIYREKLAIWAAKKIK